MTVEHHTYHFDAYPMFAFVPMGKKNKRIRTVGQKVQKGMIHRLHEHVKRKIGALTQEEKQKLQTFLEQENEAVLPIPLNKEDELYPHLIKPEQLLWQTFSQMHGLPIHNNSTYQEFYLQLSTEDLDRHLDRVIRDYLFCAELAERSRVEWEDRIVEAYQLHPFIQLAREKENVVKAVERMNHSPLISLLNSPEDLAYWRHRVDIVMRPYREVPDEWLWNEKGVCHHEKEMRFHPSSGDVEFYCETCGYAIYYDIEENHVHFKEEIDMDRAKKRIVTIERQFNEMVDKPPRLVEKMEKVSQAIEAFKPYAPLYAEVLRVQHTLSEEELALFEAPSTVMVYQQLKSVRLPEDRAGSPLIWFSYVLTDTIEPFKPRTVFPDLDESEIAFVRDYLEKVKSISQNVPSNEEEYLNVKQHTMTIGEMKLLLHFIIGHENEPLHVLSKVFTGQATNAIRAQRLHENEVFGLLQNWQEKYVVKGIKYMEKDGLLLKLSKGYGLTEKANRMLGRESE
ncbi:RQC-minor-2 family DNA-binding protein [Guptibacillus hwajinpoensis]|uniref:RQC-minor-2 family DNA-binding protein n=1 Tax=Guptibacillus hwajinpoensis TaxID=208199 RepID=UPI003D024C2A